MHACYVTYILGPAQRALSPHNYFTRAIFWVEGHSAADTAYYKYHSKVFRLSLLSLVICLVEFEMIVRFSKTDGGGGIYCAIKPLLPMLENRGISYLHVYCVDNILCRVADPFFIGSGIDKNADCATKVSMTFNMDTQHIHIPQFLGGREEGA